MKINTIIISFVLILSLCACKGGTKEDFYAQGLAELNKGNPNSAVVFFKNALEKDSGYYDARSELAKAFLTLGKTELAENEFVRLLKLDPTRDQVRLELAKIYIVNRKTDTAITEINTYNRSHGTSVVTFELLGIASMQQGDAIAAENYFLQALAADPSQTKIKQELAAVYIQFRMKDKEREARRLIAELLQSNPKETGAYYLLADLEMRAGNRDKVLAQYQAIVNLDPADSFALYKSGLLLAGQGDLPAAEKIAQTLTTKFPKRSESYRLAGIVNYYKNDHAVAIANLLRSVKINPTDEATYYLGLSYYRKGDLESALSQFYKIVDKTIYSEPSRLLIGMILLNQRRLDDAIIETKKLLAIQPDNALAHNILGSAYMAQGLFDEGVKEFNRTIELDPRIIDAHLKKGIYHLREGRLLDAEVDFSSAVQAIPELLNTRQILSSFYLREGKPEKAMTILKEGLTGQKSDAALYDNLASVRFSQNKQNDGFSYLLKAQAADPDYPAATIHLATYYVLTGEPERALKEYRQLLEKNPGNLTAWLSMAALFEFTNRDAEALDAYQRAKESKNGSAYLALADYLMRKSRESEAHEVLNEAIKIVPGNLAAREMKFRIFMRSKDFKEAVSAAGEIEILDQELGLRRKIEAYVAMHDQKKALEGAGRYVTLHPNSASGYILQSWIYEQSKELDQAVAAMKSGIRVDRDNVEALVQLGNLYARMRDYKMAKSLFDEGLRKDANSISVIFALGALFDDLGDKAAAIKKYLEVLEKDPQHVPALNNLAYLYVTGFGEPEEGLRLAFVGFRLEPGNPLLMDTLGLALLKNGRSDAARKVLEKTVVLLPDSPTVAYHLALAYRDSGMKAQAVKVLSTILTSKNFPEAEDAKKIYEDLSKGN